MNESKILLCKCGASYSVPPHMEISVEAKEGWRETHAGPNHGPCSYFQNLFVVQRFITSAIPDFWGARWV